MSRVWSFSILRIAPSVIIVHIIGSDSALQEIGPYKIGWKPRKHSWVQEADLLFVDSPVGTGFSYVTSNDSFAHDNDQIASDLTEFLRQVKFLRQQLLNSTSSCFASSRNFCSPPKRLGHCIRLTDFIIYNTKNQFEKNGLSRNFC